MYIISNMMRAREREREMNITVKYGWKSWTWYLPISVNVRSAEGERVVNESRIDHYSTFSPVQQVGKIPKVAVTASNAVAGTIFIQNKNLTRWEPTLWTVQNTFGKCTIKRIDDNIERQLTSEQKGSFNLKSRVNVCTTLKNCEWSNLTGSAEMYSSIPCLRARSVSKPH